jgi:hypothetical protein
MTAKQNQKGTHWTHGTPFLCSHTFLPSLIYIRSERCPKCPKCTAPKRPICPLACPMACPPLRGYAIPIGLVGFSRISQEPVSGRILFVRHSERKQNTKRYDKSSNVRMEYHVLYPIGSHKLSHNTFLVFRMGKR